MGQELEGSGTWRGQELGRVRWAGAGQVRNQTGGDCLGINQADRRQTGKGTAWTEPGGGWTGTRPVRRSEQVRATKVRNGREQARGPRAGASAEAAGEPWTVRGAADRNRHSALNLTPPASPDNVLANMFAFSPSDLATRSPSTKTGTRLIPPHPLIFLTILHTSIMRVSLPKVEQNRHHAALLALLSAPNHCPQSLILQHSLLSHRHPQSPKSLVSRPNCL
ncbi:hypothetical protein SKAU_G00156620 [Synaphobranchus kaupii]|uniref:Uncharacterized protein n=1 Tax=Synaphobranchus kaupii TaxID=118154 RepID=A0A9Q1FHP1_SYNKA|nr:hypothetical protein SKAU_G00156620 [Synaphobranchus kaupii]